MNGMIHENDREFDLNIQVWLNKIDPNISNRQRSIIMAPRKPPSKYSTKQRMVLRGSRSNISCNFRSVWLGGQVAESQIPSDQLRYPRTTDRLNISLAPSHLVLLPSNHPTFPTAIKSLPPQHSPNMHLFASISAFSFLSVQCTFFIL